MGVGWPPWPSKRVGVELRVERVEGLAGAGKAAAAVEVRWKGPMARGLPGFRRRGEAGATRRPTSATALDGGVAEFGDEFRSACGLSWVAQISLLLVSIYIHVCSMYTICSQLQFTYDKMIQPARLSSQFGSKYDPF